MDSNNINDYVLINLFSMFSFEQLFQRRRVCLRWKSIIDRLLMHRKSLSFITSDKNYSPKWHSFNDYDISNREYIRIDINSQQLDHILSKCQNLLSLDFVHKTINYSFMKVMSDRCLHLIRLDLSFCSGITSESLLLLGHKLINLKEFLLINCDINESQLNLILINLKKLEILDVSNNFLITGESFRNLRPNLKSLNVIQCKNITNKAIISLSSKGSHLRKLFIGTYCENPFITDSILNYLCLNLEQDLKEFYCIYDVVLGKGLELISKFKRLEVLILTEKKYENNSKVSINDKTITAIMKECNQLKRLEITSISGQNVLTDKSLSQINQFCPHIQRLNIESFFKISNQTLISISKLSDLWYLQLINLDIDDNGIVNILQSCQHLRHFAINFSDKMFAFPHKITNTIVMTCIDVANHRKNDKILFRVMGACLPSHRDLYIPENLTLQIVSRQRV